MTGEMVHDDMLFNMLKECKTLPIFMDHVFGFLKRRSDFYVVAENTNSPVGLPSGLSEALVRQSYMKYTDVQTLDNVIATTQNIPVNTICSKCPLTNRPDPSKCYNGASFDNYSWSQTYNEIDLYLKLPLNTTARDIVVSTTGSSVCIKLKEGSVLLQGDLCHTCKSDLIWSIDAQELLLHLEKCREIWWDCFLTTEIKLDISKMECIKPLEDLPEDAQAKIHELQWNQEQKRLGLPTSDEINLLNKMRKAWNAEESPFSGPFDPTAVSFN